MQLRSTGFVINIDQHGEGGGYLYGILESKTGPTYTVDSATSALTLHAYHTMQVQSTSPNLLHQVRFIVYENGFTGKHEHFSGVS